MRRYTSGCLTLNRRHLFSAKYVVIRGKLTYNDSAHRAAMAELVDALDSGSSDRKVVEVQVLFAAPKIKYLCLRCFVFFSIEDLNRGYTHASLSCTVF